MNCQADRWMVDGNGGWRMEDGGWRMVDEGFRGGA